jgi:hypothetical protein
MHVAAIVILGLIFADLWENFKQNPSINFRGMFKILMLE